MGEKKERVIELIGNYSIEKAMGLKELFSNGLLEKEPIVLDVGKLESIDITFIQLFYAFLTQAKKRSIDVSIVGELEEKVRQSLDLTGIDYSFSDGKVSIEG